MEKVIIKTFAVSPLKRTLLFDILLPENYPALTGISVSTNKYIIAELDPGTNIPIGTLRLFMSDCGDELFSEAVFANAKEPEFSAIGSYFTTERIYNFQKQYCPFKTKINTEVTLINGFYQDDILSIAGGTYTISIYLHFENEKT